MSEDSLDSCEVCEAPAARVLSAPAVHFKGSGFYTTDYARKGAKKPGSDGGSSDTSSKDSKDSKDSKGDSKSSDSSSRSSEKAGTGSTSKSSD
jgi:predicted nucleic acid-binding Zn ribbon protein